MNSFVIGEAASAAPSPATILRSVVQRWREQIERLFDPYRPELHYMRGPGPKWRARANALEEKAS